MKKTILLIMIMVCAAVQLPAQNFWGHPNTPTQKKVLFLLAADAERIAANENPKLEDFRRSVIGFWCGAQIALEELESEGRDIKVIVRDINPGDEYKLQQIFQAPEIQGVDLIIAPVAKNTFPAIANFANTHRIKVVNPFSTDSEIVIGQPYVCKLQPPMIARPAIVRSYFAGANFILWSNPDSPTPEISEFERYFTEMHIPCHRVSAPADFAPYLSSSKTNVVISGTNAPEKYVEVIKALGTHAKCPAFSWIVPESLISNDNFDTQILKNRNIYFFSNNFVNQDSEDAETFIYKYFGKFGTIPTLESFGYQGYDVTKTFVGELFPYHTESQPLSYSFKMIRREDGGYENFGARLVQMRNLQYNVINPQ